MKKEMLFLCSVIAVSLSGCKIKKRPAEFSAEELNQEGQLIHANLELGAAPPRDGFDKVYYYIDTDGDKNTAEYVACDISNSNMNERLRLKGKVLNANQTKPKMPLYEWKESVYYFQRAGRIKE
ncbi:MAG: hypothetical protein J6V53_00925 [Alphaproteobacteria bacterium]|nr:hypothetical protein [Alphaproteobacteria bacterium]